MAYKISNFARMSLVQSAALADTSLFVSAKDGDLLPVFGASDSAPAVLFDATGAEIVYITAEAAGTLTVTRAQEGTAARDWPSGTKLIHTPTAALFQLVLNAAFAVAAFIGTATNVGDAYTVNVGAGNPIPQLSDGERVSFLVPATNGGPSTVVITNGVDSTTIKAINSTSNGPLNEGDLTEDFLAETRYVAAAGTWFLITDTTDREYASSLNTGPLPAVSRHPNGRVEFWRNGTSFVTPASLTETADGWSVQYDGTIGTFTVNRQTFLPGQIVVPGNPRYFIRWDQSSAGSGSVIRRFRIPIPGVAWRSGKNVIRSVWMKADASRIVSMKVLQDFGTGGAPSLQVEALSQAANLTTNWQKFDLIGGLPSVSGKTIGSNLDDSLILTLDLPVNVSMTIDIALDDFRPGIIAGVQSDTFPLPTWLGGTGGAFATLNEMADEITGVVHIAGIEGVTGAKTFTADFALSAAAPRLLIRETDQAANEKLWDLIGSGGDLLLRSRTDADGAGVTALTFDRGVGTAVTSVTVGATSLIVPDGSAVAPGARVASEATGLFRSSATALGLAAAGSQVAVLSAASANFSNAAQMLLSAGSAAAPALVVRLADPDSGRYSVADNNVAEATNGVLRFDWDTTRLQMGVGFDIVLPATAHAPTSVMSVGYRGTPVVSGNSAYAFPLAEAGHAVYHDEAGARTYTIPANASIAHPIGTFFIISNTGNGGAAGAITLAITSDTLQRGDGTAGTGTRTIPAASTAQIRKVAATVWEITGIYI